MKINFKKNMTSFLFAVTLLLFAIHCTAQGNKQTNEKTAGGSRTLVQTWY